jgi:hypothetical protein
MVHSAVRAVDRHCPGQTNLMNRTIALDYRAVPQLKSHGMAGSAIAVLGSAPKDIQDI